MTLVPKGGNDNIYTPKETVETVIKELPLSGEILDPSAGGGVFGKVIHSIYGFTVIELDIKWNDDFFDEDRKFDWIVTNPPWSKFKQFLEHSTKLAYNIAFLVTITHFVTKARLKILHDAGFYIKQIHCIETPPKPWPQSGFQVAMVWCAKGKGPTKWIY
jgi:hypothetical protein